MMTDREKVIKGLEHCSEDGCKDCPYETDCIMADGFSELAKDVLELLKEQESTVKFSRNYMNYVWSNCGVYINDEIDYMMDKPISFCPACGRKVKWDD